MDRMSPLDASFIHIEDANNPMHIGSVVVFEGPAPAYGDLVRQVASKLPLVPRYRQKVREVPFQLGRPVWIDDPHFTILYHIRRTGVPAPGGDDELRNLAGRVLAQHLDRARPLWELWMVEGLKGDRWALIAKTHHAMVDGVSGTDLLAVLLDVSPDGAAPVDMEWRAQPEPNALQLLADTAVSSVMDPMTHVRGLPAVARRGGQAAPVERADAGLEAHQPGGGGRRPGPHGRFRTTHAAGPGRAPGHDLAAAQRQHRDHQRARAADSALCLRAPDAGGLPLRTHRGQHPDRDRDLLLLRCAELRSHRRLRLGVRPRCPGRWHRSRPAGA